MVIRIVLILGHIENFDLLFERITNFFSCSSIRLWGHLFYLFFLGHFLSVTN
jgi:hypothetical protein